MSNTNNFPFEINRDPKANEEIKKYTTGGYMDSVLVGPKKCVLFANYQKHAATIYNMPLRSSDIFVVTYPRSGTTWTQELVWLVNNDLDYAKAKSVPLTTRYPYLEASMFVDSEMQANLDKQLSKADHQKMLELTTPATDILAATPSPRFIKSHLHFSLLPPSLLDTAKVVYVARDPRDAAVSFYHFSKSRNVNGFSGDFKQFFSLFMRDLYVYSPWFEHVKEAWQQRHHPNMLFLFYEELIKDLKGTARRVADFFGKQYSDEQLTKLAEHLHFDNFSKNKSVDLENMKDAGIFGTDFVFIRKGKSGGWREYFDEELEKEAECWMEDNMRGTDLVFPF